MLQEWHQGEQTTLGEVLDAAIAREGDAAWLDIDGVVHTAVAVRDRAYRLAARLAKEGVRPGDTIVAMLDNSVDLIAAWFGVTGMGAVFAPINPAYRGEALRHQAANAGARLALVEAHHLAALAEVIDGVPRLDRIVCRGAAGGACGRASIAALDDGDGSGADRPAHVAMPGDLACLIYTSGTTGVAKGCMVSHNYLCNLARQNNGMYRPTADDVFWTPLPLFHMNALCISVIASLLAGARVAVAPRFEVDRVWPEIARTGATIASLLGTQPGLLAKAAASAAERACAGQLRAMQGAPFGPDVAGVFEKRFGVRSQVAARVYGITEACVLTAAPIDVIVPEGSAGRRHPDFDVRIVDEQGREVADGEAGEVVCRPRRPNIMFQGYWNMPEATAAITRDLWLRMGDIGRFDADGFFYFLDRKKDWLRCGDRRFSSIAIDTVLMRHPDVLEAAVTLADEAAGSPDLKATLVAMPGTTIDPAALHRWAAAQLEPHQLPRFLERREWLPKNGLGRVLKYQLREEGVTPGTWDAMMAAAA